MKDIAQKCTVICEYVYSAVTKVPLNIVYSWMVFGSLLTSITPWKEVLAHGKGQIRAKRLGNYLHASIRPAPSAFEYK